MTDELDGVFEEETSDEVDSKVDESVQDVSLETETTANTQAEPTSARPESVPFEALKDERQKRQRAEARLEELESLNPQTEEAPDPITDPEEYENYVRGKVEREFSEKAAKEYETRVNESRGKLLEEEADYVNMEKIFMLMATQDDTLADKMNSSSDPARFAYDTAKAYRDTLLGKPEVTDEVTDDPATKPTPSLSKVTAQASNSDPVEQSESMDEMFEDMAY